MDYVAPVIRHFVAPLWSLWERSPYLRHYRRSKRTQYDPPEVILARQWDKLALLIRHAYETTQFYRDRLDAAGLHPRDIRSLDAFRALPLLTKADLRERKRDMLSSDYADAKLYSKTTSGSTGPSR